MLRNHNLPKEKRPLDGTKDDLFENFESTFPK